MTADQQAPAAGRQSRTRLILQGALSLVLVAAIFYYLLTKLDPAQVWAAITDMTWTELTTLSLLAVWNLRLTPELAAQEKEAREPRQPKRGPGWSLPSVSIPGKVPRSA